MPATIKTQLEECENYLFALDKEIKELKGSRRVLIDINTPKTNDLAMIALKELNRAYAKKAKLEKIINYYVPLIVRLNERVNLSEDIELAAIEFYAEEEKDKV